MRDLAIPDALGPGDPRPKGDGVAIVHVSVGWWVAFCGRPFCLHAEWFGISRTAGVGGLTETHMTCPACGWVGPARWPAETLRRNVEQLLGHRPDPSTRNWLPHETLADLAEQNFEKGILSADTLAAIGSGEPRNGPLLATYGDEITVGARELAAPGRLALPGRA